MAVVTVTSTIAATCHYWLTPKAVEDTTGKGISVGDIVHGWVSQNADGTPATLSLQLDNAYMWDVLMDFRGAPPIVFSGFNPGSGGDFLTLLAAQGWMSL